MAKRRRKRTAHIKAPEYVSKDEERKAFPAVLIKAYIKLTGNWDSKIKYKRYVVEARKYLGAKYDDPIESGKLVVLLFRATTDLRDDQTKEEKS